MNPATLGGFPDPPTARASAPRAVIFDMDGTLTEPLLDFDAIRAEIGLQPGLPILEQLAAGDEALRARGEEIMRRHERDAIASATLADGCVELLDRLCAAGVPCAILTRNVREVVESFVRKFDLGAAFAHGGGPRPVSHDESAPLIIAAYTREDGPPKPAPDGVLHLCRAMHVAPADTLVVGDYTFDIVAGRAAGCRTALVTAEAIDDAEAWGAPDMIVRSLRQLIPLWE
jgi:phosphoglycolate phosphatase-like HAD superfamily hydrolase